MFHNDNPCGAGLFAQLDDGCQHCRAGGCRLRGLARPGQIGLYGDHIAAMDPTADTTIPVNGSLYQLFGRHILSDGDVNVLGSCLPAVIADLQPSIRRRSFAVRLFIGTAGPLARCDTGRLTAAATCHSNQSGQADAQLATLVDKLASFHPVTLH